MKTFQLYSTSACHLCELAEAMIHEELRRGADCQVECLDISDCDDLFQRYATTIPVLRHPGGSEMNWPFDPGALAQFLRS